MRDAREKQEWLDAMQTEIDSLHNGVWKLVELPKYRKCVGSKWVFKVNADGSTERCKARLVYSQKGGLIMTKLLAQLYGQNLKLHQLHGYHYER